MSEARLEQFEGHVGIGPPVEGIALVASDGFSARYDLDRDRGVVSRPSHKLYGMRYVDRILVLDAAKGGVASAWMLREMVRKRMAPLGLLLNDANPVMAQGAAFAHLPLIDRFDTDITRALRTGDRIAVDPARGIVRVLARA